MTGQTSLSQILINCVYKKNNLNPKLNTEHKQVSRLLTHYNSNVNTDNNRAK